MEKQTTNQEAIIAEYLTGEYSYRQLGEKHGFDFRKIHYWVSNYQGKIRPKKKEVKGACKYLKLLISQNGGLYGWLHYICFLNGILN